MKVAVDLHIHTALSPCAADDMTPNNIVNMASLKGLEIIAVTDHNSVENCEAVSKCAESRGLIFIPGMELETREEVHLICLFPGLAEAFKMQDLVYKALPDMKNREDIFGRQLLMDENDNIRGSNARFLLTATSVSVEDAFDAVNKLGGAVMPAHVDRESYSIISNLGLVPQNQGINYLEISTKCDIEKLLARNNYLRSFQYIRSSDAHMLGDILERESFIDLEECSASCLINSLRFKT